MSCAIACSATAQNIDKVFVKDGSVYEGYISSQTPGQTISVRTTCATLFVDSKDVTELVYTTRDIKDLPRQLGEWAKKNYPNDKTLQVASMKAADKFYTNAVVLETGARIKILFFADDMFDLDWKNILKTAKTEEWLDNTAGIIDVVTLKDGKHFVGHVIEQIIGYELRIRLKSGEVNSVRFPDIMSIRSEQTNPDKSLWEQLELLDKVELKDGTAVEGFITSRVMGRHLTIITPDNAVEKEIPLKDVTKYAKVYNEQKSRNDEKADKKRYEPRQSSPRSSNRDTAKSNNTESNDGSEVYLNGLPMTLNSLVLCDGNINAIKNPVKDKVSVGMEIKIEMPATFNNPELKIVRTQMRAVAMVSAGNGSNAIPTFNKRDIDKSYIGFGVSDLDNGNVVLSIVITEPGIYAIVPVSDDNKCIVFEVIG